MLSRFTWPLVLVAVVVSLGYAGSQFGLFSPPCDEPVEYYIGEFDARFGISRSEFTDALSDAAALWNEAAGKTVVVFAEDGDLPVHLEYGSEQKTSQLGEAIDEEQEAYDTAKANFQVLADDLEAAKSTYAAQLAAYDQKTAAYEKDVDYWNDRGGAPPAEYQKLQARQRALEAERVRVNAQAKSVNAIVDDMNSEVEALNDLAAAINKRVDVYNANAHTDFDQGRYIEDKDGKRITIREFTEGTELRRVLAHEFGHALGMDHVENPDAIMYSYNVGSKLALSEEDHQELSNACELD